MRPALLLTLVALLAGCAQNPAPAARAIAPAPPPAKAYTGPAWYRVEASPEQIAFAQDRVTHDLKDPSSAQFRGLYALSRGMGDDTVCGEINAKNSYGAYVGFRRFYVMADGSSQIATPGDVLATLPAMVCNKPTKPSN